MPLFLDRHDSLGHVTKDDILAAHQRDIAVGAKYGVYFVTYWCDLETGLAFCHIDAPSRELALQVHREAHGDSLVADKIIEVNADQMRQFLGRVLSPDGYWNNALRTILVTDIASSTAVIQRLGDEKARELFDAHDRIVGAALALAGGRKIKHTGDGVLAAFDSVVRALECATTIQRKITEYNERADAAAIAVRVGLSAGEPVTNHEDLFGAAVHQATRICQACDPGRIVASSVLRDLSIGKGFVWKDLGETQLRGFADPVRLYELGWAAEVDQPARASSVDPTRGNLFLREGEYWTIVYEGEAFRLKDTKGLRYLSQLLRNPGREFHAIDLVSMAQKREPLGAAQPGHEVVSRLGDAGKILDAQAKAEYRRRLDELREQLEEANRFNDRARSDALQSEIDFVTHELAAALGRSGRDRKSASAAERARVNVTRTIADALRRIAEHNGSLSRHLENTVKTGTFCSYTPDPRVQISW